MVKICDNCAHLIKLKHRGRFLCDAETRDVSLKSCRDFKPIKYDRSKLNKINIESITKHAKL